MRLDFPGDDIRSVLGGILDFLTHARVYVFYGKNTFAFIGLVYMYMYIFSRAKCTCVYGNSDSSVKSFGFVY